MHPSMKIPGEMKKREGLKKNFGRGGKDNSLQKDVPFKNSRNLEKKKTKESRGKREGDIGKGFEIGRKRRIVRATIGNDSCRSNRGGRKKWFSENFLSSKGTKG